MRWWQRAGTNRAPLPTVNMWSDSEEEPEIASDHQSDEEWDVKLAQHTKASPATKATPAAAAASGRQFKVIAGGRSSGYGP